jgi:hypothetical protein
LQRQVDAATRDTASDQISQHFQRVVSNLVECVDLRGRWTPRLAIPRASLRDSAQHQRVVSTSNPLLSVVVDLQRQVDARLGDTASTLLVR